MPNDPGTMTSARPTIRAAEKAGRRVRTVGPRKRPRAGSFRRKTGWAYLFLAPQLIGLVLFSVIPTATTIVLSFTDFQLGGTSRFVGFSNYTAQFSDPVMRQAVVNTIAFTAMYVPALIIVALSVAVLMLSVRRGLGVYQTAYFLPLVTSTAATALVWALVFQPDYGLANKALSWLHLPSLGWFSSTGLALPTIVLIAVWAGVANAIILFIAGLQSVPSEITQAALVDGAGRVRRFFHITLPMISPITFFVVVITVIHSLQVFGEPYIITKGGPGNATTTVVLELYRRAFEYSNIGPASAIACMLLVAILLLTLVQFRLSRWVHYDR